MKRDLDAHLTGQEDSEWEKLLQLEMERRVAETILLVQRKMDAWAISKTDESFEKSFEEVVVKSCTVHGLTSRLSTLLLLVLDKYWDVAKDWANDSLDLIEEKGGIPK